MSASTAPLLAGLLTLGAIDKVTISLILIISGVLIIAWPLLPRLIGRLRRFSPPPPTVQERAERATAASRERVVLDDLASDVREVTRLCAAQLDARAKRVEEVLEKANATIARLEALVAAAQEAPPAAAATTSQQAVWEPPDPTWAPPQSPEVTVRHVRPGPGAAPVAVATPNPSLAVSVPSDGPLWPGQASHSRADALDPLTQQICQLSAAGHSAVEIAARLEEHVGKVELILALQRR